jgi:HK97 family phage prohead protease
MKNKINVDSIKNFVDISGIEGQEVERKQYVSDIQIDENEEKTFIAAISTINEDIDGDIVYPQGCDLTKYVKNPVVLWNHGHSSPPIGKIIQIQTTNTCIFAKIKMADTNNANEYWKLIKGGFLKTCSIGFIIKNYLVRGTYDFSNFIQMMGLKISDNCKRIINNFYLIENSMCSIPANSEALVMAISTKSLDISDKLKK